MCKDQINIERRLPGFCIIMLNPRGTAGSLGLEPRGSLSLGGRPSVEGALDLTSPDAARTLVLEAAAARKVHTGLLIFCLVGRLFLQ